MNIASARHLLAMNRNSGDLCTDDARIINIQMSIIDTSVQQGIFESMGHGEGWS